MTLISLLLYGLLFSVAGWVGLGVAAAIALVIGVVLIVRANKAKAVTKPVTA